MYSVKKFFVNGVERTQEVLHKLADEKLDYSPANIVSLGWSKTFIEATGLLPNPYHQYYFQTREVLEKDLQGFKDNGTRAEVVHELEKSLFELYKNPGVNEKPKELEKRGGAYYSDVACSLMDSIYNDKGDVQTVNTLNKGAIPDLPNDSVIEVNSVITKHGPHPIVTGPLPLTIRGMMNQMKSFEELVVQAGVTGNYYDAYTAMVMNPLVSDEKGSKVLLDELLEGHKDYLPQFNRN